jgi:hypothetical protein
MTARNPSASNLNVSPASDYRDLPKNLATTLLSISSATLMVMVWISTLLFGLYILAFYGGAILVDMQVWNETLPGLYEANKAAATTSMGSHFIGGSIILILGCIQLLPNLRKDAPKIHRITGRVYLLSCFAASIGGTLFILFTGTIGGLIMDIGFGLYGLLMFLCTLMTLTYAMRREIKLHQAWALRLFALAIGSWLYRMDYGFWHLFTGNIGHSEDFTGWFDRFMAFFFFLPNLLIAELFIRSKQPTSTNLLKYSSAILLFVATLFVVLGTYAFTSLYWGPAILGLFS